MKVFSLALLNLLLAALWTGHLLPYGACCYKRMFIQEKIPVSCIRSYQETPSHCSRKAVRAETLKRFKFCVDPKKRWFQQYRLLKESRLHVKLPSI